MKHDLRDCFMVRAVLKRHQSCALLTSNRQPASRRFRTESYQPKPTARPKKRKPTDEGQDESIVKSEAEGQENALNAENKILRAEIKLLKDSVTDLRIALASKTELIEELRQSRVAEREKSRLFGEPTTKNG
ncbi:hypothetical protein FOQG_18512 [Fusarium oxysporum f. sp. raphani 54005]|uniref:Uncharacterized protein n=1 Tax=Fusarium oxysporum f. sp. raphani 54005 TaxID=1089458 RepID=X0BE66_FUSOX|nr:hypothetical protein FOQG_18512 [Fusarium oxysporum f. sp. raphani 54005]